MSTRRLIIDCDPGIDDAVTLLIAAAHPAHDLQAITCVAGNKPVDVTSENARRVLDLAGRPNVPVHRGAERPLLDPLPDDRNYYGADGIGDIGLPDASRPPDPGHAVDAIVDTVMSAPAGTISLCAIGPLTNVALAFRKEPELAARLGALTIMGGDVGPDAAAEFNISTDAAAAHIVFSSDASLTLVSYDITRTVQAGAASLDRLAATSSQTARAAGAMLRFRKPEGSALHDVVALAALVAPDLFTFQTGTVGVEWRDVDSQGMTTFTPEAGGRHRVVTAIDRPAFERFLLASLTGEG